MATYYRIQPIGKPLPMVSRDMDGNKLDGIWVFSSPEEVKETLPLWGYPDATGGEEIVVINYEGPSWQHDLENGTLIDSSEAQIVQRMPIEEFLQSSIAESVLREYVRTLLREYVREILSETVRKK